MNKNNNQRMSVDRSPDLLCFSHLRWNFVFQRPQHLMSRFAAHCRVFFIEEMVRGGETPELVERICPESGVVVVTPQVPSSTPSDELSQVMRRLLRRLLSQNDIRSHVDWYYTPMALEFTSFLRPVAMIYDCMDELSMFRGAPAQLTELERELMRRADLVFTGGLSLFEAKCNRHPRVYAFPSSVDFDHFVQARQWSGEPADQAGVPHPRIGYAGVIDERIDYDLMRDVAGMRPHWQLLMLGPLAKVDPEALPRAANIHYLGMKPYDELPAYFAGWDIGMLPFAMNDATRFISPTKTPEYLTAGLKVISTPVKDVVRTYGDLGLVRIAANAREFCEAADELLDRGVPSDWRGRVDSFLGSMSWDRTWADMDRLIREVSAVRRAKPAVPRQGVIANV